MGLNRKLIRWISNFLHQRKLIISINDQLSDPIIPIHGVPQGSPLSPILFILYVSDMTQPPDVQVNLSKFADDIAILGQVPGICSINLRLQKYLNQTLQVKHILLISHREKLLRFLLDHTWTRHVRHRPLLTNQRDKN